MECAGIPWQRRMAFYREEQWRRVECDLFGRWNYGWIGGRTLSTSPLLATSLHHIDEMEDLMNQWRSTSDTSCDNIFFKSA
jgi:hypothetical protein